MLCMNSFLSTVKWLLFLILGLPLAIYLFLLLLNIVDDDKSNNVIEFEQFLSERATLRDKNNAFVYAAGLSAKAESDFYVSGVDRIAKANSLSFSFALTETNSVAIDSDDITTQIGKNLTALLSGCGEPIQLDEVCNQYLLAEIEQVDAFLSENNLLFQRYKILTSKPVWYESQKQAFNNQISMAPLSIGHKVVMLNAWREAARGGVTYATSILNQDSAFWRNAIVSTHSLINLMVMKSVVEENYHWGSFVLQTSLTNGVKDIIPTEWQTPIINDSFSLKNVVIGEWAFTKSIFNEINNSDDWYSFFIKPLFNIQNSLNLYAEISLETLELEPFDDRSVLVRKCEQGLTFSQLGWYSYNPVGKILMCSATPSLKNYRNQLDDLEKTRQSVMASLQ